MANSFIKIQPLNNSFSKTIPSTESSHDSTKLPLNTRLISEKCTLSQKGHTYLSLSELCSQSTSTCSETLETKNMRDNSQCIGCITEIHEFQAGAILGFPNLQPQNLQSANINDLEKSTVWQEIRLGLTVISPRNNLKS